MLEPIENIPDLRELSTPMPLSEGFIFHTKEFQDLKKGNKVHLGLFRNNIGLLSLSLQLDQDTAISGAGATFGSFNYARGVTKTEIKQLMGFVEETMFRQGIKYILIKHWPDALREKDLFPNCLRNAGYSEKTIDVDQYIRIGKNNSSK